MPAAPALAHRFAEVNGVRLHYVTGGRGEPVLLLHGWPQTWYVWREVAPVLARRYEVIAPDLRGLGESSIPESGYDTGTVAADLHALLAELGHARIFLVGHDVGTWVAYAYASAHPEAVRRLVVMDAALPGLIPPMAPSSVSTIKTWHFGFNALPELPELLVTGRERAFVSWLFRHKSFTPTSVPEDVVEAYARAYAAPGRLTAGFAYYRAIFETMAQNRARAGQKLTMPVLAVGGETGVGDLMETTMRLVADDVRGVVVPRCGHYVPDERPEETVRLILEFLAGSPV
jgi:pimeloyl-ACP methyl ester carboxylesterase